MGANRKWRIVPSYVKTLRDIMDDASITISALCSVCGASSIVDIPALAEKVGPDYSLVNRRSRCTKPGCKGWVRFKWSTGVWAWPMWDEATERRWNA